MKMKQLSRTILATILCVVMLMSALPVANLQANAASFEDINNSSVFVKQNTNYTCTLASAVMLVRRTAMAAGNNNWASITESSMRGTAWLEGSGLYYNFTYAGVSVGHASAGSSRKSFYINLLKQYPQGVVAYNSGNGNQWHAILLTDYNSSTDTFYCADPANGTASGRIALASSSIVGSGQNGKINNLNEYWYVKSPSVSLTSSDKVAPTITNIQMTRVFSGVTFTCNVADNIGVTKVSFPTWTDKNGQDDLVWHEAKISNGMASCSISASDHNNEFGDYITHIYVYDAAGNNICAPVYYKMGTIIKASDALPSGRFDISSNKSIFLAGWAFDPCGSETTCYYKFDNGNWIELKHKNRPDVVYAYRNKSYIVQSNCGYGESIPITSLSSGEHTYTIKAQNEYYSTIIATGKISITIPNVNITLISEETGFKETKSVKYYSSYGTLPTLEKQDFKFDGWFTEKIGGTKIESNTKVENATNHNLYAHWTCINHTDSNNDGYCDACNAELRSHTLENPTVGCTCICHKTNGFSKFIYRFVLFFWDFLGIKQVCDCGEYHYQTPTE